MRFLALLGVAVLPLTAAAQRPAQTHDALFYLLGPLTAPLYASLRDTLRPPAQMLPARTQAEVVGKYASRWVVVKRGGFTYFMPASRLERYDPADLDPLPVAVSSGLITYQGVGQVPGVGQAALFARATAWLARAYPLQNGRLEQRDSVAGRLVVQGQRTVAVPQENDGVMRPVYAGVVRHTLTITVKDGRYKYVFTNLTHDALQASHIRSGGPLEAERASLFGYVGLGSYAPWTTLKTQATRDIRTLAADLQAAMGGQTAARKLDDEF